MAHHLAKSYHAPNQVSWKHEHCLTTSAQFDGMKCRKSDNGQGEKARDTNMPKDYSQNLTVCMSHKLVSGCSKVPG